MVSNKKAKRGSRKSHRINEVYYAEGDEQKYGKITKCLGDSRFTIKLLDGSNTELIGLMKGSLKRRMWVRLDDIVLITLRDFEQDKCDIIGKYNDKQKLELMENNIITNVIDNNDIENEDNIFGYNDEIPLDISSI